MPRRKLTLRIKGRTDALNGVLDRVERYCRRAGVARSGAADLRLALEEVLANLIAHAWPQGGVHEARITVGIEDGELAFEVSDDGVAFDPETSPPPPLDASLNNRPVGGLGLFIVRRLGDRLDYSRENGRNRLRWRKRLDPPRESTG
jgi:serine/threonine-protein kinase RsbW